VRVLVDTSALLALSHKRDQYHGRAVRSLGRLRAAGGNLIGTTAVLSEFYSHLLYLRGSTGARTALSHLLNDSLHEWLEVTAEVVTSAAVNWLDRFPDQSFSLVDAISFETMRRQRVKKAFAFDQHFTIAGFELFE
jgi:uncharacterized protein